MRCHEAQQLFDSYLDAELSPSLTAELDAHRLQCGECRRALAILEVTGHVLSAEPHRTALADDFTNRLMACVETPRERRWGQVRRYLYAAGPLAAAAVIALAFLGAFDRTGPSKVAGVKVEPAVHNASAPAAAPAPSQLPSPEELEASQRAVDDWIAQMRANLEVKRQSSQSIHRAVDLTVLQLLNILEEFNDQAAPPAHFPGADEPLPFTPRPNPEVDDEDVEDL